MLKIIILSIIIIGIAVLALAVKMFFIKGGMFTKTCSSINEKGEKVPCTCQKSGEDKCENYKHYPQNTSEIAPISKDS